MARKYRVLQSADESGAQYEQPRVISEHQSLDAARRSARARGHYPAVDGESVRPVAHIVRISDEAQMHPWSDEWMLKY